MFETTNQVYIYIYCNYVHAGMDGGMGMDICIYVCTYVYVCVCVSVCLSVCMSVCMHACMYVYIHVSMHMCMSGFLLKLRISICCEDVIFFLSTPGRLETGTEPGSWKRSRDVK